jgi:integrase
MIRDVPRKLPPHLCREVTRHGRTVWFVRVYPGRRIRIRATFDTPEFWAEYQATIAGEALPRPGHTAPGTLAWLIERYRETTAWTDLSPATRRNRENHFKKVMETAGAEPIRVITQKVIIAGRDRRARTPAQARNFLDAMRGLFKWAHGAGHVATDPTTGVKNPKRKKGPGFPVWTEDDALAYERRWPLGTKERVWRDVLFYTGLRRGDAVQLGRQHVRDGIATLRTEKSQGQMIVCIPILPILQRTLDAGPTGELAFICGVNGKPLTKESFGNAFKDACRAAGVVNKSAHGCRKIAATRLAEAGATVAELNAIFGWSGTQMASLYTEAADRKRLALQALPRLDGETKIVQISPAPDRKVRGKTPKDE